MRGVHVGEHPRMGEEESKVKRKKNKQRMSKRALVVAERGGVYYTLWWGDEILTASAGPTAKKRLDEIAHVINVGRDSLP